LLPYVPIYARDTSANSIPNTLIISGLAYIVPTIYLPGQLSSRPIIITRAIPPLIPRDLYRGTTNVLTSCKYMEPKKERKTIKTKSMARAYLNLRSTRGILTSYASFESFILGLALSAKLLYSNRKPGLRLIRAYDISNTSPSSRLKRAGSYILRRPNLSLETRRISSLLSKIFRRSIGVFLIKRIISTPAVLVLTRLLIFVDNNLRT
jgi:hypothetical protein